MSGDFKYMGMDVHKESISIAVMNGAGKFVMESTIEIKAATILQVIHGLQGDLYVTFEEGTWAAWLYDLLQQHVTEVVVCNPRKNALLKSGNKSDRIDARKLAELLRNGSLSGVYHGENGIRTLKELARSYLTISKDLTRVMNRIKALYRSWAIPCEGTSVYAPRHRSEWLNKVPHAGVRRRAEYFYGQLDGLNALRREVRRDLLTESQKHRAAKLPLDGSSVRDLTVTGWSGFKSFDWSVDGRGFFISNASGLGSTLLFVDLNGKSHPLWQQKSSSLTWGVPSPDGRYLAVLGQEFNGNMWMIENF